MNTIKEPTAEQVEIVMTDWLRGLREEGRFVGKNVKGAISRTLARGESFSGFALGDMSAADGSELARNARTIAQSIIDGMTDERVAVTVGGGDSWSGRGAAYRINVATDHFDDSSLTPGQKVDIMCGFAVHEACHINHTDFDRYAQMEKTSGENGKLMHTLMNILEDERIELLLGASPAEGGDGMPGLTDYLACAKERCFKRYGEKLEEGGVDTSGRIESFLNTLLLAVRFPASLKEEDVRRHFPELDKVRRILTPYPKTAEEVGSAARGIIKVMKDMIEDELRKQQQQQQKQEQQPEEEKRQDNGDGQQENSKCDGNSKENQNAGGKPESGDGEDKETEGAEGTEDGDGSPSEGKPSAENDASSASDKSEGDAGDQQDGPTEKDVNAELERILGSANASSLLQAMDESVAAPSDNGTRTASCIETGYANGDSEKCDGSEISRISRICGNKSVYESSLRRVRRHVPAMSKALRCKTAERDYELLGMDNGRLDTNRLAGLKAGNTNIFSREGTVTADSACVCILIDESGSMRGPRQTGARDAAVLINEAVKQIPNVELFVYGFTSGDMHIYCERRNADRWGLGSTLACGFTPTADAMSIAAKRIRRMTGSVCLMLVITDGAPDDRAATIEQDRRLAKRGFLPVGVDIAGGDMIKDIFRECVSITDMNELAPQLAKITRKKLNKAIKIHDTLS